MALGLTGLAVAALRHSKLVSLELTKMSDNYPTGESTSEATTTPASMFAVFQGRIVRIGGRGMYVPIDSNCNPPDSVWQHVKNDEQASNDISDTGPGHTSPPSFFWEIFPVRSCNTERETPRESAAEAELLWLINSLGNPALGDRLRPSQCSNIPAWRLKTP